ncbi:hypothetical protein Tco_0012488 [Tanacetum coccineum]
MNFEYPQELFLAVELLSLLFLVLLYTKKVSMISFWEDLPNRFVSSILLLVEIVVTVVIVVVMLVVTFPSMLRGRPPIKASKSFSLFGTMFGHKFGDILGCQSLFNSVQHICFERILDSVCSNQLIRPTGLLPTIESRKVDKADKLLASVKSAVSWPPPGKWHPKVMAGVSDVDVLWRHSINKDNTDKDGDNDANGGNEIIEYDTKTGLPL